MNGRERVLAMLDGHPVDHLPLMPITMMFAADLAGVSYRDYASDHEVLAEAQVAVAEAFGFDHVSAISDPAREVSDLSSSTTATPSPRITGWLKTKLSTTNANSGTPNIRISAARSCISHRHSRMATRRIPV